MSSGATAGFTPPVAGTTNGVPHVPSVPLVELIQTWAVAAAPTPVTCVQDAHSLPVESLSRVRASLVTSLMTVGKPASSV